MRFPLAVLFSVILAATARADDPNPRAFLDAVERQLKAVHESAGPCVACVVVSRSAHYPKPAKPREHAGQLGDFSATAFLKDNPGKAKLATHLDISDPRIIPEHSYTGGVVVDAAGLVLTTFQPLDGASKVFVHLPGGKGSYANIHAADTRCDLAVLKLLNPPAGLKSIKIGDVRIAGPNPNVAPGKLVVLLTNPFSTGFRFDKPSGGLGSITNVRRRLTSPLTKQEATNRSAYAYGAFLEHDAKLHAETSGAALVNLDGELIGLTTLGHTLTGAENGPGFAFPMDEHTRRIIDVLKRGEEVEYGYFGIQTPGTNFNNQGFEPPLTVTSVSHLSPAAVAGLRQGDTISRINDVQVNGYSDLLYFGGSGLAGTTLKIVAVDQRSNRKDLELTLGKYKHDLPFIASVRPEPVFGLRVDYGSILAQTLFNRNRFGEPSPGVPEGVCVRELVPDSPAAAKFKALGDAPTRWLITHANGVPVPTPAAFSKAAKGQGSVKLSLIDPAAGSGPRELTIP